ncbi:MAG: dephospho-CoA kinase [Deltaproteobacteria bacterium]|nr:dephospho-CoA kinase [Deltaproteobacteria bacterium]
MNLKKGVLSIHTREQQKGFMVWGLTGGVACGKSTVAKIFEENKIPVIDADHIAHELSLPGGLGYEAIIQRFGTSDRAWLRKTVFNDQKAKEDLEAILHPLIQTESLRMMRELQKTNPKSPIIYEAALLVEKKKADDFEGLIVVETPREMRKKRLIERDQLSEDMAEKIFASQTSDEVRRNAAAFLIENNGTLEELREKVLLIIPKLFTKPQS